MSIKLNFFEIVVMPHLLFVLFAVVASSFDLEIYATVNAMLNTPTGSVIFAYAFWFAFIVSTAGDYLSQSGLEGSIGAHGGAWKNSPKKKKGNKLP